MTIAELKSRVGIIEVVQELGGRVVPRWGMLPSSITSSWIATKCPFHSDRSPSASVNPLKGKFHCHSCGVHGDIIDLAKLVLRTDNTREAMSWLRENFTRTMPSS